MLNDELIDKVSTFINKEKLINKSDKCLLALSGGADSVALTLVLKHLGYLIEAVHCNFHLRGPESDRDENFCISFCKENNIKLHLVHFDTKNYATLHKISIEMAARNLRYAYFEQLRNDINASTICVAHHKDDTVETVLMNLVRGTGIHGLTGIAPRNGYIVRPLLCVFRNEIEDFLNRAKQSYVTDSTNLINDVVRNKIRLDVIPLLKEINPSVSNSIAMTAKRINDAAKVYDRAISADINSVITEKYDDGLVIDIERLLNVPATESVLFSILKNYGFGSTQIEQISLSLHANSGKTFISKTHQLLIDRNTIIVEPINNQVVAKEMIIPETGTYIYNDKTKLSFNTHNAAGFSIDKSNKHAYLDANKVKFPLTIRPTKQGDKFIPFGMNGTKLVSDFLTDKKITLFNKHRQLVVCDSLNRIIWIVGLRIDNRFRITSTTTEILQISQLQNT